MIIVAGIFYYNINSINKEIKKEFDLSLSRNERIKTFSISRDRIYITIGSLKGCDYNKFFYENNNSESISILLGNPYLENSRSLNNYSKSCQLVELNNICSNYSWEILKNNCRGVFSVIHYEQRNHQLTIISDKLGVWPIYYYLDNEKVIFSSALRIIENCSLVKLNLDTRGVAEIASFGFALSNRTAYKEVKRIRDAEIIQLKNKQEKSIHYWHWDSIPECSMRQKKSIAEQAFQVFEDAIKIRLAGDDVVLSFLSGGLDSRCIVSCLNNYCSHVHAFNFSQPNSQDRLFAAQLAAAIGVDYCEGEFENSANWSQMIADAWKTKAYKTNFIPERPWMVWSGDGGSVGTGFVYLNEEIIDASLRGESIDKIIELYLVHNKISFPYRILTKCFQKEFSDIVSRGVRDEMKRYPLANPARALHLYLMVNDQRRHLDRHFENLDVHNLEFHLPFFDSFFLEVVFSLPIEYCINHIFYNDWFKFFPPLARSVPWQTYPGHTKCPLPISNDMQYQWEDVERKNYAKEFNNHFFINIFKYIDRTFPSYILNRNFLILAMLLHSIKIKDFDYLLDAANIYIKYISKCSNNS